MQLLISAVVVLFIGSTNIHTQTGAVLEIEEKVHDFGQVDEGQVLTHKFVVKNTGKQPLKLTDVKPSCGCTLVEYTKTPIVSGETGFVQAEYDTRGRPGSFLKSVKIKSNGGRVSCYIKGNVKAAQSKPVRK